MDKIWDRKSFEVWGNWPLWWGWKKRMITQYRQKAIANKNWNRRWAKLPFLGLFAFYLNLCDNFVKTKIDLVLVEVKGLG